MDNNIEQLSKDLVELTGNFIFPEYYPHTNCLMWKILNPFTKYGEEKFVLVHVDDEYGVQKALTIALAKIAASKEEWSKHPEWHK